MHRTKLQSLDNEPRSLPLVEPRRTAAFSREIRFEKLSPCDPDVVPLVQKHANAYLATNENVATQAHGKKTAFVRAAVVYYIGVTRRSISEVRKPVVVVNAVTAGAGDEHGLEEEGPHAPKYNKRAVHEGGGMVHVKRQESYDDEPSRRSVADGSENGGRGNVAHDEKRKGAKIAGEDACGTGLDEMHANDDYEEAACVHEPWGRNAALMQ
jgi:hypothetical protein